MWPDRRIQEVELAMGDLGPPAAATYASDHLDRLERFLLKLRGLIKVIMSYINRSPGEIFVPPVNSGSIWLGGIYEALLLRVPTNGHEDRRARAWATTGNDDPDFGIEMRLP
jgi:hypothetical protein